MPPWNLLTRNVMGTQVYITWELPPQSERAEAYDVYFKPLSNAARYVKVRHFVSITFNNSVFPLSRH